MPRNIDDLMKWWPIIVTICLIVGHYTLVKFQIEQHTADIAILKMEVSQQKTDAASVKATINSIQDNVLYIRGRVDSISK